jgi:integrase
MRHVSKLDDQGAHITTIAATRLLLHTMTRKSELLRSKWDEFDLDAAQWDIPAERMKMGKPHRVFLSREERHRGGLQPHGVGG